MQHLFDETFEQLQREENVGAPVARLIGELYNRRAVNPPDWREKGASDLQRRRLCPMLLEDPFVRHSAIRPRGYPEPRLTRWMTHLAKAVFTLSFLIPLVHAQDRPLVTGTVDNSRVITFEHSSHPKTRSARDLGRAPGGLPMDRIVLTLQMSPERQDELEQLIAGQHDPISPLYRKWLTPEEYGSRFGPAQQDIDAVTQWLQSQGFQVDSVSRGRRFIEFSGDAKQVEDAFHTEMHHYELDGEVHVANAIDIAVPEALAPVIAGPPPLNNFHSKPMHHSLKAAPLGIAVFSGYIDPQFFADVYNVTPLWNQGFDGTGETIAIAGRSNINLSDVVAFRKQYGFPTNNTQVVVNGPDPGILALNEESESILDTEWAGAVAKDATVKLVVSKSTNAFDGIALSIFYIIDNNLAPVMSDSYGNCEANLGKYNSFYAALWQQAAAQGISAFVASGDSGSAGCDNPDSTNPATLGLAVNGFASSPYTIAVGGTKLGGAGNASGSGSSTTSVPPSQSYIPESVWNESSYSPAGGFNSLLASGGGLSAVYAKPSWQTGPGVPAGDPGNPSQHHRYLPDVSLAAAGNDPYLIQLAGITQAVAGTSVASPAFAGLAAILDQYTGARNGNLNTRFYSLASQIPGVFHDVTDGNNAVPCGVGTPGCSVAVGNRFVTFGTMSGYAAGPGYDLATGLGSVDAYAMAFNWQSPQPPPRINGLTPNPMTASATPQTLTIDGAYFSPEATVTASYPGGPIQTLAIASYSSGRLKISFSSGTQAETWTIVIKNPNGQSASGSLQVNAPRPTVTSLNPNPMTALATPQTLTINGANFSGVTQVLGGYNGGGTMSLPITSVTPNQITVTIDTGTATHTWNIVVETPTAIAPATLQVNAPPPVITSLNPNPMTVGVATQYLTINGSNFAAAATVTASYTGLTGSPLPIISQGANRIIAKIATGTSAHTWTIVVANPDGQTASTTLTVH